MKKDVVSVFIMVIVVVLGVGLRYYMQNGDLRVQDRENSAQESVQSAEKTAADGAGEVNQEPAGEITKEVQKEPEQTLPDNNWGVVLSAKDVTSDGMQLMCSQSGGKPTGELSTGPWYEIEVLEEDKWCKVPTYAEVCWEDVAWVIQPEDITQWKINWTWIYGSLPQGEYRISKEIMDFRQTGDFDTCRSYAYFSIE